MDDRQFDRLTRSIAEGASRRSVIKGLLGLGTASTVTAASSRPSGGARRGSPSNAPPTPTLPPTCGAGQVLCNGVCCTGSCTATGSCCAQGNAVCGGDCCAPGSQCCDGACCNGTCYGEELCCPSNGTVCGDNCCLPPSTCDGSTCSQAGACAAGENSCSNEESRCFSGNCLCLQTLAGETVCSFGVYGQFGCGSCYADSDCPAQTGNPNSVCVTNDDVCTTCADGGVCAALCPEG